MDYLSPEAKAAEATRTHVARPARTQRNPRGRLIAPPADIHDGQRSDWFEIRGPGSAHAMLGNQQFGIMAFVMDGRDRTHFLNVLYKGNCREGWQPYPKAQFLDAATNAAPMTKGRRQEDTPSLPWVETQLQKTCFASTPSQSLTVGEAMWKAMSEG